MRILYVGSLGPEATSLHRLWALRRLGHEVVGFDHDPYLWCGGRWAVSFRLRTLRGPPVWRFNRDLLAAAGDLSPDLVWFDKALLATPATVRSLRAMGALTVHFNIDNPFGPRGDPGWRLVRAALPDYDLHAVQRDGNLADYRTAGARDVVLMRTAFEPTVHFPAPAGWSDEDRPNEVVFVGTPYDDRAAFLAALWRDHGIPLRIWGNGWDRALPRAAAAALWQGPSIYNEAYRRALWQSRICLAFVTRSNCDDVAHKSFEIAACGAFLLAEDTPGHRAHFAAGEEAMFFTSVEDCAATIRRYLGDEAARARIGAAARRRCEESGYDNDSRLASVLAYLRNKGS